MFYLCVLIVLRMSVRKEVTGNILRRMYHLAVTDRLKDDVGNVLRDWSKQVRSGYDDLFPDAKHQIRVDRQVTSFPLEERINQIKVFYDHSLSLLDCRHDGAGQLRALSESLLKADIQMIGVRGSKEGKSLFADTSHSQRVIQHLQQRQRANVDTFIIICQFQTWEHTFDQHTFSRTCVTDYADELVGRAKILLGNLHSQFGHTDIASRSKIDTVQMADVRHEMPPCPDTRIGILCQNPYPFSPFTVCLFD